MTELQVCMEFMTWGCHRNGHFNVEALQECHALMWVLFYSWQLSLVSSLLNNWHTWHDCGTSINMAGLTEEQKNKDKELLVLKVAGVIEH